MMEDKINSWNSVGEGFLVLSLVGSCLLCVMLVRVALFEFVCSWETLSLQNVDVVDRRGKGRLCLSLKLYDEFVL